MAVRVRCPSCGRGLLAQELALGWGATCPACLAEIPKSESQRAADAVRADQLERRGSGPSCPGCGRDVEPIWLTCPWCEEPLRGREPRRYGRPDLDVRRDQKGTSGALFVLAVVGSLGVVGLLLFALAMFNEPRAYGGGPGYMIALVLGLLFLAAGVLLVIWLRSGGRLAGQIVGRVYVGTLAAVGGLMLLSIAVLVFLFFVCLARGMQV